MTDQPLSAEDDVKPPDGWTFEDEMRLTSTEHPRSRWHREETTAGRSSWACVPVVDAVEALYRERTLAASPPTLDRLRRIEAAAHALVDDDGFTKDREREWRDLEAALKEPSDD